MEFLILFGIPIVILILAACFARAVKAIIGWGLVAMVVMGVEYALLLWAAGIGSATSGSQSGYQAPALALKVFGVSLAVYCIVGAARL